MVCDRRAGKNIYYALEVAELGVQLSDVLRTASAEIPETKQDQRALRVLRARRADLSREYFNRMAGKFGRAYVPGRTWQGVARMLFALVEPMVIADALAGMVMPGCTCWPFAVTSCPCASTRSAPSRVFVVPTRRRVRRKCCCPL